MQIIRRTKASTILIALVVILSLIIAVMPILKTYVLSAGWLNDGFPIFKWLGVDGYQAVVWLSWLAKVLLSIAVVLIIYRSLYVELARTDQNPKAAPSKYPSWTVAKLDAIDMVFADERQRAPRMPWPGVAVAAFFALLFAILYFKGAIAFKDYFDSRWHMRFLDYDLDWETPWFSLSGNILNQFGMQPPFNTDLSPLNGLAHLAPLRYRIVASVTLFYSAAFFLVWVFGRTIALRPIPRVIVAGVVGLIVTIPVGVDSVIPFAPPLLFTANSMLTHYWLEAGILCLSAVMLFFWLGQSHRRLANLALAIGFCVVCYDLVLLYPAATFLIVPVMLLYCASFLFTIESVSEFWWKVIVGGALSLSMLATHIPAFIFYLYAFCFGPYFRGTLPDIGLVALLKNQSMITAFAYNEPRVAVVFAVALGVAFLLAVRGKGPLKRFAIAVLICEFGLVSLGSAAVLIFHFQISMYYAEVINAPFLLSFFVLYFVVLGATLVVRSEQIIDTALKDPASPRLTRWAASNRLGLYLSIATLILVYAAVAVPTYRGNNHASYPPAVPPSVKILDDELALKPGVAFRGRVFVLARPDLDIAPSSDISPLALAVFDLLENHYGAKFGNDHWADLFPLNIPMINESYHYTSALNFFFLRTFFGKKTDVVDKAFFMLRAYDERVARMIGIRYVVTDAANVPGGALVYQRMAGDMPLRLFRIDGTNLGQFSPTRLTRIAAAADAIAAIKSPSFDPEQDAVVEEAPPANLVPGTLQSLTVEAGPVLHVQAQSQSTSLLVLPFEYSHCLRLMTKGDTSARLIPVNLQQTGLLFDGHADVEITYSFGPLQHPECRGDDLKRADTLRLREAL